MQNNNLRMVFFPSLDEAEKSKQIEEIRVSIVGKGPCSIIVPVGIVPLIKKRLLVSCVLKPSNMAKPTEEQIKAMVERSGAWQDDFFITREILNLCCNKEKGVAHAKRKET